MIIDKSVRKDCYAITWSYGEICVGCGCCSEDPYVRIPARIAYHEYELDERENFNGWFEEDPDIVEIQKKNLAANIDYHKTMIQMLKEELGQLKGMEE